MPTWSQDACISALALSLLHSLWQGAILGLVGVALAARLRRSTPDVRYTTYSLLLAAMFAVWLGTFCSLYGASIRPVSLTATHSAMVVVGVIAAPAAETPLWSASRLQPLFPVLVALWAAGVCVVSLRHLGGLLMLRSMCRAATDSCPQAWADFAERIAKEMGIRRKVLLRCSARVDVPCAFGIFRSYILLPLGVMAGLTPQQAEALIAHEMAHLARHDVFFNAIQVCMETAMFYHPAVRWLSMQVRAAREQRCDDLAIRFVGDRVVYARALFSLEEARAPLPRLALGARGENSPMSNTQFVTRIQRVLGVSGPERRDPWFKGVIAAGAMTAGLVMLHPVHAFDATSASPAPTVQTARAFKAVLLVNGNKYELNSDVLTPDTAISRNGKPGRFGDLTPAEQTALKKAVADGQAAAAHGVVTSAGNIRIIGDAKGNMVTISRSDAGKGDKMIAISRIGAGGGNKLDFSTTDLAKLAADTAVTVNGKTQRVSDLTESEQTELKRAFAAVPALPTVTLDEAGKTSRGDVLFRTTQSMRIVMDINGDKIELDTDKLTPDTTVTVNGKPTRFGDLTPTQQKQLQEKVDSMPRPVMFKAALADRVPAAIALRLAPAVLNLNGDKIEIDDPELTSESAVTINGKRVRFGDLSPARQEALRQAVGPVSRRSIDIAFSPRIADAPSMAAVSLDGKRSFKILLNINGDEIALDTPDLNPDTPVTVNGKQVRFGDLTPTQQKQLKDAVTPATTILSMPAQPAVPAIVPDGKR